MSASDHVVFPLSEKTRTTLPETCTMSVDDETTLDSLEDSSAPASAREMALLRRTKSKEESLLGMLRTWIVDHQIGRRKKADDPTA